MFTFFLLYLNILCFPFTLETCLLYIDDDIFKLFIQRGIWLCFLNNNKQKIKKIIYYYLVSVSHITSFILQIRVSSEISNAPFILNLDCDMYSNNANTIQEVLCFFLDETKGHDIAYVQFPQSYNNIAKNDHYANSYLMIYKVGDKIM